MKLQIKLGILGFVLLILFTSVFIFYRYLQERTLIRILEARTEEIIANFDSILELKGATLKTFSIDYTFWDEMVDFVKRADKEWAEQNIKAGAKSFGADAVWVYNLDFNCIYKTCIFNEESCIDLPLKKEALTKLFSEGKRLAHFFIRTPTGLMEVRAATIHPTIDTERKTPAQGYFFAAKLWDKKYIEELSRIARRLSEIKLSIFFPEEEEEEEEVKATKVSLGLIKFSRRLPAWDQKTAAYLKVEFVSPLILLLIDYIRNNYFFVIFFFIIVFVIIGIAFLKWINLPLRTISRALKTSDAVYLKNLKQKKDEFGQTAQLITEFFDSRKELYEEIQERKRLEEELRKSETHYRLLAENIKDVIWTTDLKLRFTYISPSCKDLFGYSPEELLNLPATKLLGQKAVFEVDRILAQELAIEALPHKDIKRSRKLELEHIRKDGSSVICELIVTFLRDEKEKATGILGVTRDITERRKMEEEIKESEHLLKLAHYLLKLGTWKYIPSSGKTIWSEEMFRIYGLTPQEEAPPFEVLVQMVHPDDRNRYLEVLNEAAKRGEFHNFEYRIIRTDGQCRWLLAEQSIQLGAKEGETIFYGTVLDITERKEMEIELQNTLNKLKETQEQLIQSEKLQAIGRLASGIAHEVKNPLGIILQSTNYLEEKCPREEKEILKLIKENIKRADKIINVLVDFSKATKLDLSAQDINSILEDSLSLVLFQIKLKNIEIIKELKDNLPKVMVDKRRIEQVFVNLLLNAFEAMPEGGKLYLRTYERKLVKSDFKQELVNEKDLGKSAIFIEIEDTGVGIPEENLKIIFEPFFTTKGPERGTGLGLAVTKNIIDLHKGLINIESKVGKGTKVTVILKVSPA